MRKIKILLPAALMAAASLLPTGAFAHEHRTIANGKYEVTVGWDVEPAFAGQKNAASIRIAEAGSGSGSSPAVPVEGADKTLKVRIRQGAVTREFPLRAVFGQKGYYVADLLPTRDGDYQWTFVGTLNGEAVNDTFDTADGKFNKVQAIGDLQFPQAVPDGAQTAAAAQAARAEADQARTIGYLGVGLGLLGTLTALASLRIIPLPGRRVARREPAIEAA
jgi:hypothetical protein